MEDRSADVDSPVTSTHSVTVANEPSIDDISLDDDAWEEAVSVVLELEVDSSLTSTHSVGTCVDIGVKMRVLIDVGPFDLMSVDPVVESTIVLDVNGDDLVEVDESKEVVLKTIVVLELGVCSAVTSSQSVSNSVEEIARMVVLAVNDVSGTVVGEGADSVVGNKVVLELESD